MALSGDERAYPFAWRHLADWDITTDPLREGLDERYRPRLDDGWWSVEVWREDAWLGDRYGWGWMLVGQWEHRFHAERKLQESLRASTAEERWLTTGLTHSQFWFGPNHGLTPRTDMEWKTWWADLKEILRAVKEFGVADLASTGGSAAHQRPPHTLAA